MYKEGNMEMWFQRLATAIKANVNKLKKKFTSKRNSSVKINKIKISSKEGLAFSISRQASEKNVNILYIFEDDEYESYHNQMKPVFFIMRLFGALPFTIRKSGVPTFRIISFVTAYTVCFWIVLAASSYINFRNSLADYYNKSEELGPSIFICLHIIAMFSLPIVPVATSADVKKLIQYMNQWVQFSRCFKKVTRKVLILSVRRISIKCVACCCIAGMGTISFHYFTPYVALKYLMPYVSMGILTTILKFLWYCTYKSLEAANNSLIAHFKRDLTKTNNIVPIINEYRILWLQLSELVSKSGEATGKIFVLYHIFVLIILIFSIYGCLSGIRIQKDAFFSIAFMSCSCIITIVPFYMLCSKADNVSTMVKTNMDEELQIIKSSRKDIETIQEVDIFMLTILTNPPLITVNGFTETNKGLFKAHISTLVTYLVVLLQFDVGQPEDRSHSNTTNSSIN